MLGNDSGGLGTLSYKNIPVFLAGVYIFHIAFGSYYHYLGSY
ncbi:MAG: hypothetical protein R2688_02590 [Fimbriimonadaceae bacterium]